MPIGNAVCNARHINHVCLAVSNIEEALEFYKETFGIAATEIVDIKDQGVRAALVEVDSLSMNPHEKVYQVRLHLFTQSRPVVS